MWSKPHISDPVQLQCIVVRIAHVWHITAGSQVEPYSSDFFRYEQAIYLTQWIEFLSFKIIKFNFKIKTQFNLEFI